MILHGYWRSSCSWRVRIALAYKGLQWTERPVHLVRDGGEQHSALHLNRNPMAQVPVLELDDGTRLTQSMAILEYLEEQYPTPRILPTDPLQRARARQLAETVNAGVQPLQNLAVLQHLKVGWGIDGKTWARRVIQRGLDAMEAMAAAETLGPFLIGNLPTIADMCLIPQLYNARRFGCDLSQWPHLLQAESAALALPAFVQTRPENTTGAVSSAA